jgi:hypothetical protein
LKEIQKYTFASIYIKRFEQKKRNKKERLSKKKSKSKSKKQMGCNRSSESWEAVRRWNTNQNGGTTGRSVSYVRDLATKSPWSWGPTHVKDLVLFERSLSEIWITATDVKIPFLVPLQYLRLYEQPITTQPETNKDKFLAGVQQVRSSGYCACCFRLRGAWSVDMTATRHTRSKATETYTRHPHSTEFQVRMPTGEYATIDELAAEFIHLNDLHWTSMNPLLSNIGKVKKKASKATKALKVMQEVGTMKAMEARSVVL